MVSTEIITVFSDFLCMLLLAKLGHEVLAASALFFSIHFSGFVIAISLLVSLNVLIGRAYGQQNYQEVGILLQQGWLLGVLLSIPLILLFWNIYPLLILFGQDPKLALIVKEFFRPNTWAVLPWMLCVCNQNLCNAVHKQKFNFFVHCAGVSVLLISAFVFIFGKWGFPKLGVAGFGYASTLQAWFYFFVTLGGFRWFHYFRKFDIFRGHIFRNWNVLKKIFVIGWPIALQISSEMLSFFVCAIIIGWVGAIALAGYQIMMQYEFLIVLPVFALAQAGGVLISQAVGAKQFADVNLLAMGSLRLAIGLSLLFGLVLVCFPKVLAGFYLVKKEISYAAILTVTVQLFMVLALSQFIDGIKNILVNALRGLFDTRFPMIIGIGSTWLIGVPLGYWFALPLQGGAVGAMIGWTVGSMVGMIVLWYRWRTKVRLLHP